MAISSSRPRYLLVCSLLLLLHPASAETVGLHGDGSNVFPSADPPSSWDEQDGSGIAWRTPLPGWSWSSPVVLEDRVYLRCDPNLLVCVDAAKGAVLWSRPLDLFAHWPDRQTAERDAKQWRALWQEWLDSLADYHELMYLRGADKQAPKVRRYRDEYRAYCSRYDGGKGPPPPYTDRGAEWSKRVTDLADGLRVQCRGNPLASWSGNKERKVQGAEKSLGETYGLRFQAWHGWCGLTFQTPVSDGTSLFVADGRGSFFRCDRDGEVQWATFLQPRVQGREAERAMKQRVAELGLRFKPYDAVGVLSSPVLADGILVCKAWHWIAGLEAVSGKILWLQPDPFSGYYTGMGTPAILRLEGLTVVLTSDGKAYRLQDGKLLAHGLGHQCWAPAIVGDVALYGKTGKSLGGIPAGPLLRAVRFRRVGDTIATDTVWSVADPGENADSKDRKGGSESCWQRPVVHDGIVYLQTAGKQDLRLRAISLADGRVLGSYVTPSRCPWAQAPGWGGSYGADPAIAGDRLFVHTAVGYTVVFPLGAELAPLQVNTLESQVNRDWAERAIPWSEFRTRHRDRHVFAWERYSVASPAFVGSHVYVRTNEALYKIGR